MRTQRRRENLVTWLIVGPWAIVLAFPFYWMLWTSLKTEQDLYNVENVPFSFSNGSPTFDNVRFLFEETDYARWLWNTVLVGIVVVVITLAVSMPAGYALARLSGRWGQSLGVAIFLVYLVPPTLLFLPLSRVVAYSSAKAAVLNLTQFLAREWAAQGVRVNSLTPGFFPAEQNRKLLFNDDGSPTARTNSIWTHTPMKRFGEGQELVGACIFLASQRAASFVTGIDLRVDGGFLSQTI